MSLLQEAHLGRLYDAQIGIRSLDDQLLTLEQEAVAALGDSHNLPIETPAALAIALAIHEGHIGLVSAHAEREVINLSMLAQRSIAEVIELGEPDSISNQ